MKQRLATLLLWVYELLAALVLVTPVHAWARAFWGTHPDGDAGAFEPGGYELLAWLSADAPTLGSVARTTVVMLVVFGIASQLVTAIALALLDDRPAVRAGAEAFFPMALLTALTGSMQLFVLGVGFLLSSRTDHAFAARLGDARSFLARIVVFAVFAALAVGIGVFADLARAACLRRDDERLLPRLRGSLVDATRAPLGRALASWAWRAALAGALVWLGAKAGDVTASRGGSALVALFLFHQLVVLARAGIRASWLGVALARVRRVS